MSNTKREARHARSARARHVIRMSGRKHRLCVYRSNKHICVQLIENGEMDKVLASASTRDKELKELHTCGSNKEAAASIGAEIAKKALGLGIKAVAFDRSGYKYHGRVKSLADAARENGLEF